MISAKEAHQITCGQGFTKEELDYALAKIEQKVKKSAGKGLFTMNVLAKTMVEFERHDPCFTLREAVKAELLRLGYFYEEFKSASGLAITVSWLK